MSKNKDKDNNNGNVNVNRDMDNQLIVAIRSHCMHNKN
jgi:hypothetical protein